MIFGIGLSRTATTSLHHAFELLGLRSAPTSVGLLRDLDHQVLQHYEAFTDNPIPFRYRDLDARFPGARFVLTTRPLEPWLDSMEWLFSQGIARLDRPTRRLARRVHRELYGLRRFDAEVLADVYHRHHRGVATWFMDRPGDLLEVDFGEHDDQSAWHTLCDFVSRPVPAVAFPKSNRRDGPPPPASLA